MAATGAGLFESLKGFASTGLEIVHTRLELFITELVEERVRLGLLLTYAAAAVILLSLGAILVVTTLAVVFWEQRVAVFVIATALFLGSGLVTMRLALKQVRGRPRMFSGSLGELAKDRAALAATTAPGGESR